MKNRFGLLLPVVLALALVGMGTHSTSPAAEGGIAAAWSLVLKGGSQLVQHPIAHFGKSGTQTESGDKICGSITCHANSDRCTGCDGNPICIPKRSKVRDCLIECPAP